MSRNGIRYHDVAKCAEELYASGAEPTIERIRFQLKTGSNSTIGAHLRMWRAKRNPLQELATKEKIPEELVILLKGLWERVMVQAETQIETIKTDTQQDLVQHRETIEQLQQNNARLQQSEAQLKQARDGLGHEKVVLEKIVSDSRTEAMTLQTKYDGLLQQFADKQTRVEELHQQNKQIQANLEHYQAAQLAQRQQDHQRAEQRERELTQAIQRHKVENDILRQQKTALQQSHDQLQSEQSSMHARLEKMALQDKKMSTELMEITVALANKTASEQHWQTQYDILCAKREEHIKTTTELQTQNAVLAQQIMTVKAELTSVAEQNKMLAHDKWMLGQEKAQLFGQVKQLQIAL